MDAKGLVPAAGGSLLALMAQDHNGTPIVVFIACTFAAMVFGLVSKYGRAPDRDKPEVARQSLYNAGALFIVTLGIVFMFDMKLPGASVTALAVGLLGAWVLDALESSFKERWKLLVKAFLGKN